MTLKESDKEVIQENLGNILEQKRGKLQDVKFDPTKNEDYDADLAKIGRDKKVEVDEDEETEESRK